MRKLKRLDLIYITNTAIPSKKANTYQSLCVCESLSKFFNTVEFWHPSRRGDYLSYQDNAVKDVKNILDQYGVNDSFQLRRLFSVDIPWINKINAKFWFYLQVLSFSFSCLLAFQKESADKVVFMRDAKTLLFLVIGRKIGLIKQKIFYEAHYYSLFQDRFSRMADGVVVINHHLKSLYDSDDRRNILVAHDAVKQSELVISEQTNLKSNIKFTENNNHKLIIYSGNLFAWKGVYTLADCVKHLPSNCKVIFLGGSEDALPAFNDYVSELSQTQIEVLGFKPKNEVRSYLDIADVLILPNSSKHDWSYATSPLKLFEYMAARKPIVASRLPSLQEILRDGENAILFNPDDPKDLAKKIIWVLENDCSEIVEQAWQDVQEYTWEKRTEKIITWMEGLGTFDKHSGDSLNKKGGVH